jgi:ABC-2 type transport system permease protein
MSAPTQPHTGSALSTGAAVRLVARREFVERGRDRSFLISTAVTALILLGVIAAGALFGGDGEDYTVGLTPDATVSAEVLQQQAQTLDVEVTTEEVDPAQARSRVVDGDLDAALVGPDEVLVEEDLTGNLRLLLDAAVSQSAGEERLEAAGLDPATVAEALDVPPLRVTAVDPPDEKADERRGIAFVGTLLLYGQIFGYGFWVALGVVEEKSSRVVEVLLATVPARALLAGKVLGIGLLGLLQMVVLGVVAIGVAVATDTITLGGEVVGPLALVLVWFVLGFAFYATAFAAAAARVSRQEDLQNVTGPMTMLILISFFAAIYANNNPDALLSRVLAVAPPFSVLVNPPRTVSGSAAAWELPLAIALMLGLTFVLVLLAGRLYEGAVLRTGAALSWRDAWRSRSR